ncbi:MAG: hypothetical protein JST00_18350 [Deltaproteobacteria bacterium]|nr:hypothetical protein [Deltaproteobacteria bacterium]
MSTRRATSILALASLALVASSGATACSAPAPAGDSITGSEALADSDYQALIDDPRDGSRDWRSSDPERTGIAYWHVGWVKRASGGGAVEYVLATGYSRASQEAVEVVIPQSTRRERASISEGAVAYQLRWLDGTRDEARDEAIFDDVAMIRDALDAAEGTGADADPESSPCRGRRSTFHAPRDPRTLTRCRTTCSRYDTACGGGASATAVSDPIVLFLDIALDVAKEVQSMAHCTPDVSPLGDDYRTRTSDDDWATDTCSSERGPIGSRAPSGSGADGVPRVLSNHCTTTSSKPGEVCYASVEGADGVREKGTCGADGRCWSVRR